MPWLQIAGTAKNPYRMGRLSQLQPLGGQFAHFLSCPAGNCRFTSFSCTNRKKTIAAMPMSMYSTVDAGGDCMNTPHFYGGDRRCVTRGARMMCVAAPANPGGRESLPLPRPSRCCTGERPEEVLVGALAAAGPFSECHALGTPPLRGGSSVARSGGTVLQTVLCLR